jgi:hypothetical protein
VVVEGRGDYRKRVRKIRADRVEGKQGSITGGTHALVD